MKKSKRIISGLLMLTLMAGMIFAGGCSKKTSSSDTVVVTINDEKLNMQDMMYFIYAMEAQGQMYAQYYPGYWDMEYSAGVTMRDQMKQSVMDAAEMWEILYLKAQDAKYTLTDDEKKTLSDNVDSILTSIKDDTERLKLTGFTKENLTAAQEKLQIANKYYDSVIEGLDIDKDEITATVDKEKYRQYNTEYLYAATTKVDESYNQVDLTDEEKAAAKTAITKALEDVKAGKAFADIVAADDTITTSTLNFVKDDGKADEAYQAAALNLENDAVTDGIIETTSGYYIIKMTDNNSTESYDTAVTDAITQAQNDAFTTKYENEIKPEFKITVNNEAWDKIVMGETTIPVAERITSTPTPAADTTATDTPTPTESGK